MDNIEQKEKIKPVVDSSKRVLEIIKKYDLLREKSNDFTALTNYQKHELFLVKNYFLSYISQFSKDEILYIQEKYPFKNKIRLYLPIEEAEILINKCIAENFSFGIGFDINISNQTKFKLLFTKYLTFLNKLEAKDELDYYIQKYPIDCVTLFYDKSVPFFSSHFIESLLNLKPQLFFETETFTDAQKISWLNSNPQKVETLLVRYGRVRDLNENNVHNMNNLNFINPSSVVEKHILDIFIAQLFQNTLKKDFLSAEHIEILSHFGYVIESMDKINPEYTKSLLVKVGYNISGNNYNLAQTIFLNKAFSIDDMPVGDFKYNEVRLREISEIKNYLSRHRDLIIDSICNYQKYDAKFNMEFLELLFFKSDNLKNQFIFKYLDVSQLNFRQQELYICSFLAVLKLSNISKMNNRELDGWDPAQIALLPHDLLKEKFDLSKEAMKEERRKIVETILEKQAIEIALMKKKENINIHDEDIRSTNGSTINININSNTKNMNNNISSTDKSFKKYKI